jgi:hypothetical protein
MLQQCAEKNVKDAGTQRGLAWIYACADDPKLRNAAEAVTLA